MKNLIYFNLLIDQVWDKGSVLSKAFQIQNPETIRTSRLSENLSIFVDAHNISESLYILGLPLDSYWLNHFPQLRVLNDINYKVIAAQPLRVGEWIEEFKNQLMNVQFQNFIVAGTSELEKNVAQITSANMANHNFSFIEFNKKEYLFNFCHQNQISFPETKLVKGKEILSLTPAQKIQAIFKSSLSSGGAGVFDTYKLDLVIPWIKRNDLQEEWNASNWLMQKKYDRKKDYTIFGSTEKDEPEIVEVEYNSKLLSFSHKFEPKIEDSISKEIKNIYQLLRMDLKAKGYKGPFGFDSFVTSEDKVFPITDLNVRLTKTHLLNLAKEFWKPQFSCKKALRTRFQNLKRTTFENDWKNIYKSFGLNEFGESTSLQLFPTEVAGWSFGQAEATWIISATDENILEKVSKKLLETLPNGF